MGRSVARLCGTLGIVAAACLALAYEAFRRWPELYYGKAPLLNGGQTPVSFALCETPYGQRCTALPPRWLSDFYEPLGRRALAVRAAGGRPTIVHIGASNFRDDIPEYKTLLAGVASHGVPVHLLLVEPEQRYREVLLGRHKDLRVPESRVSVVTAAMDGSCQGPMVQYLFSRQLAKDFGSPATERILYNSMNAWRSAQRQYLFNVIRGIATEQRFSASEGEPAAFDNFYRIVVPTVRRIYEAGNMSEYIIEEKVPCLSGPDLVAQESLSPADIVMMTIDAEGLDAPIFMSFATLAGFRPTLQRLEVTSKMENVFQWLTDQGYELGISGFSHSVDIIAFAKPPV